MRYNEKLRLSVKEKNGEIYELVGGMTVFDLKKMPKERATT